MPQVVASTRPYTWRGITLLALLFGYIGYYLCRSNWAVAKPLILNDLQDQGMTIERLGDIESVGLLFYAMGKAVNGVVADALGGRRVFLLGMVLSAMATLVLGFTGGLAIFLAWTIFNRFVQSMGWGGLIQVVGHWFPPHAHGKVMGILSMSYLLGDALAKAYLSFFAKQTNWNEIFLISAGSLGLIFLVCLLTLKNRPEDVGLPGTEPPARNVYRDTEATTAKLTVLQLLWPLLCSATFLMVCVMNGGLTLIRETFRTWTPTYLVQAGGVTPSDAALNASLLSVAGAFASLLTGLAMDRLRGRSGPVLTPMIFLAAAGLFFLAEMDPRQSPQSTVGLLCAMSFFILGPYTLCSGAIALGLGGQRGGGTAAGLIDTVGYLAGTFAGSGIARLSSRYSWSVSFEVLAYVALATGFAAVLFTVLEYRRWKNEPATSTNNTQVTSSIPTNSGPG